MPVRARNRSGLTLVGAVVPLAALSAVVIITLVVVRRDQVAELRQLAVSEPSRVFRLACAPWSPQFASDEPAMIECFVTNTTNATLPFRLSTFMLRLADADGETWTELVVRKCVPSSSAEGLTDLELSGRDSIANRPYVDIELGPGKSVRIQSEVERRGMFQGFARYWRANKWADSKLNIVSPPISYTAEEPGPIPDGATCVLELNEDTA